MLSERTDSVSRLLRAACNPPMLLAGVGGALVVRKVQRVRDPVHNLIQFNDNDLDQACWSALDTRPLQRLRRIKQLGFSDYVYPGATHSRLAHSLGVFHTARRLSDVISERLGGPTNGFDPSRGRVAVAAALIHDIGHGPFSHAFEHALDSVGLPRLRSLSKSGSSQTSRTAAFCPNCGAPELGRFPNNSPVADLYCRDCAEQFELKATQGRFGRKVVDGVFSAMSERIRSRENPNLFLTVIPGLVPGTHGGAPRAVGADLAARRDQQIRPPSGG